MAGVVGVCETPASLHISEQDVASRWWNLAVGTLLPLSNGDTCRLLFAGSPGSSMGPDIHDAVLYFCSSQQRCVGDVEFHVRASDWLTHQHHTDSRYNAVILHVVFICDTPIPAVRQDGTALPLCSLYDVMPRFNAIAPATQWPCVTVMKEMSVEECNTLLRRAGLLRFEQKTSAFVELLHREHSSEVFSAEDIVLISSLAEGLAYGRDRALFRAIGRFLSGQSTDITELPEPLGRVIEPPSLDASRLRILKQLVDEWRTERMERAGRAGRTTGAWQTFRKAIHPSATDHTSAQILDALRNIFTGLGTARADILLCNIVYPFAAASGLIEHDMALVEQAQKLYLEHPGLSSNHITRTMSRQLQLTARLEGACQQQGLQHIYQETCREKLCEMCIVGRKFYSI